MSRAYRVQWKTATGVITCNDEAEYPIDLLDILPQDQLKTILREYLESDGWERKPDDSLETKIENAKVRLNPDAMKLIVSLEVTKEITVEAASGQETQLLEKHKKETEAVLREDACETITKLESQIQEKLQTIIQKVYVEALKKRATQLGEIESIVEKGGNNPNEEYELVIKVRA